MIDDIHWAIMKEAELQNDNILFHSDKYDVTTPKGRSNQILKKMKLKQELSKGKPLTMAQLKQITSSEFYVDSQNEKQVEDFIK